MRQTLDKKLEVRITSGDLMRWQTMSNASGFRSVSEWARATLSGSSAHLPLDVDGGAVSWRVEGRAEEEAEFPRESRLENGLTVVTERIPGSRTAAISIMVECGTRDEKPGEYGLAHLSEHMHFQGTNCRSSLDILRQVDGLGGQVGAFTTRDYTTYFACVADDYRFHALDLLADLLLNSTYPDDCLERERRVILEEVRDLEDNPSRLAEALLKGAVWPGSALGRPLTGTPEVLARLTREDVIYFVHRNYTPDRIVVVAAGNIDHSDFVAQVRDCFWRMIGASRPLPPQSPVFRKAQVKHHGVSQRAHFCVGLPAYSFAHPRRYALHLLNRILGGALSSRLFRRLREDMGIAYQVTSEYQAFRDGGMLLVEGSTSPGNRMAALEAIVEELNALVTGLRPVDEEELWLAKTQLRSTHLLGSQDAYTVMSRLGTQRLYFGRALEPDQILAEIDRVSVDEMNQLVMEGLRPWLPDLAVAWVCPKPPEQKSYQEDGKFPEDSVEAFHAPEPARMA